jgi:hypothetical protein
VIVRPDGRFDDLYLDDAITDDQLSRLTIDLSAADVVEPVGLVLLSCLLSSAFIDDREIVFLGPSSSATARYLARMGLGNVLDQVWIEHGLPSANRHDQTDRLLELQQFESAGEVDDLVERVVKRVTPTVPPGQRQAFVDALVEVAHNAVEHSVTGVGFFAAQVFGAGSETAEVRFAVGDWGQGIYASLRSTPHRSASEEAAILRAVDPAVTSYPDAYRGRGLTFVIDGARSHSGQVLIRSGDAAVRFHKDRELARRITNRPGVLVSVRVP